MPARSESRDFYHNLPVIRRFGQIFEGTSFEPVPDDWWVACTDVVGSTVAIERGLYKEVNSAGSLAAMAIGNHFGGMDFPFFFGGDGMICLVPGEDAPVVRDLLAGTGRMVRETFGLTLRLGLIPVFKLREAGKVLNLAKLEVSPLYSQAILEGDGFDEADRLLKDPSSPYGIDPDQPLRVEPNFLGYRCRWEDFRSPKDETVALIVRWRTSDTAITSRIVSQIDRLIGSPTEHHPLQKRKARPAWGKRLRTEAKVFNPGGRSWGEYKRLWIIRLQILYTEFAAFTKLPFKRKKKLLSNLLNETIRSADYRKYDNTLKMIVSIDHEPRLELQKLLEDARLRGEVFYGLHVTDRAVITCLVNTGSDHEVHFVDAADGGYAFAARQLKQQVKALQA